MTTAATIGQNYATLWSKYLDTMATCAQAHADLGELENDLNARTPACNKGAFGEYETRKEIADKAEFVFDLLIGVAAEAFAPPGGRLEIRDEKFRQQYLYPRQEDREWKKFDIIGLWNTLTERFSGERGHDEAYRQTAFALKRFFDIQPGDPVEMKSGRTVLNARVHYDSFDKKHFGKLRVSHGSNEELYGALDALVVFAEWSASPDTVIGAQKMRARFWRSRDFVSRERITVSPALEVVAYGNRFEFRFAPELAEKLQLFMATYTAPVHKQHAA